MGVWRELGCGLDWAAGAQGKRRAWKHIAHGITGRDSFPARTKGKIIGGLKVKSERKNNGKIQRDCTGV